MRKFIGLCSLLLLLQVGCIRRQITVRTDPPDALVYLNDELVGASPVTVPFTWHGNYYVRIEKQGYATYQGFAATQWQWFELPPIDLLADLWPADLFSRSEFQFTLEPDQLDPDIPALIGRAKALAAQLPATQPAEGSEK